MARASKTANLTQFQDINMETFTLTIDGVVVEATQGMTVLEAAKKAGLFIPSLCAHDELDPYGACRLCVVEIDGVRGTPTSCTTPATAGMVVRTNTEQLQIQRKRTIELMMSSHPSPCLVCDSREDCESEKAQPTRATSATRCGACSNRPTCELRGTVLGNYERDINLPMIYDPAKVEHNDPFIDKDHNLCVLCGRCFRVCEKIHGKPAIAIANRGKKAKISSEFEKAWSSEECLFCGACVEECPTGSLTDRYGKWFGAPDKTTETICVLCPKHCRLSLKVKGSKVIGAKSVSLKPEDRICALGKFAYPQIMNATGRLTRVQIKKDGEQIPSTNEEACKQLAEIIETSRSKMLLVLPKGAYLETRRAVAGLKDKYGLKHVAVEENSGEESLPADVVKEIESGVYEAALVFGNYLCAELAKKIKRLVVADFLPNVAQDFAEIVLPASILGEGVGTVGDANGEKVRCAPVVTTKDNRRPLSGVLVDVCKILGIDTTKYDVEIKKLPNDFIAPCDDKSALPARFMGHYLADYAPDLEKLGLPFSPKVCALNAEKEKGDFEILENKMLVPNFHELKVYAPEVAKFAKAGQFAILMANSHSERSPFTIIDWNASEGWVKFIIEEVGRSSAEIGALKKGDKLRVVSGPLGTPVDIEKLATASKVLLVGGCYGIGAIYPIARALKEKGVSVTVGIEASSGYLLYYRDELAKFADEVIVKTRDGTAGKKGGNLDTVSEIGANFDALVAIGCVFMMKQVAAKTPLSGDKLQLCALNPIMVDGTGMCGACRVSVSGETKFACVDGPFFKLDKVDFTELGKRRTAYKLLEIEAMPRHIGGKCHQ